MEFVWRSLTILSALVTGGATLTMLLTYRRERRIRAGSLLVSMAIGIVTLVAFALISGARTSPLIAVPVLAFGLLVGTVRGWTTRLSVRDGQVVGRGSPVFLLGWAGSFVVAQLLNLLGSALLASTGLILLFLSTGTQVGMNANTLIRCLIARPSAPVAPPPERSSAPPASLPER